MRYRTVHFPAWLVPALIALVALALPVGAAAAVPGGISGTVTGESSGALAGVEVCAFGAEGTATAGVEECAETLAPSGEYEITGLPLGNYYVGFFPSQSTHYLPQFWNHAPEPEGATQVTVPEGSTKTGVNAELERESTISGTVTAAATGLPVAGVEVCANRSVSYFCADTNGSGQYTIHGLLSGPWNVYFYPEESGQDLAAQPYPGPVSVPPHGAVTGINAALQKGGEIGGTVRLAATGAPLAGVRVCILDAGTVLSHGCLRSPPSGGYRFIGIPTGSYKIVFSPETSELIGPDTGPKKPRSWPKPPTPTRPSGGTRSRPSAPPTRSRSPRRPSSSASTAVSGRRRSSSPRLPCPLRRQPWSSR